MPSKKEIIDNIEAYYRSTEQMLNAFGEYSDEQLNRPAEGGGWSAMQNMHHLILAERMSLKYVQKKTSDPDGKYEDAGLSAWWRGKAIYLYMLYGGKKAAPAAVSTEHLPEWASMADTRALWQKTGADWHQFLTEMPDKWCQKAIYKHPAAGRLNWLGLVGFFKSHLIRHTKQMKKALLSLLILLVALTGYAQTEVAPLGCGAPPGISQWLKDYLDHPVAYRSAADTVLFTRLQLHLLAKDDGTGRFRAGQLLDALCRLNSDYAASKIQFFYDKPWNLINRTAWWDHNELSTGIQMMLQNKVDSAINCYFVTDPAGNCGYNLPYGGTAMKHSCSGIGDHTWAHEIGHNLRLPHPFIGWEGKTYNYNTPTPTMLTYDYTNFHDTLDTGPTMDTALVEYVDRTKNCGVAADRLCLTPPDYISQRWPCNAMNMSTTKQKDPDGVDFYSDGSFFMSYSFDNCQSRFSDDETAVMRASLLSEKISYVDFDYVHQDVVGTSAAVMPIGGQQVSADAVTMHWKSAPGATHYLVQGNRINQSFPLTDFEIVTTDTFATALNLLANKTWYYRVRPFNASSFCAAYSPVASFFTMAVTAVQEPLGSDRFVYPSLLQAGAQLRLHLPTQEQFTGLCELIDANGRKVSTVTVQRIANGDALPFDTTALAAGVYFVRLVGEEGQMMYKMVVER
jgi:DinB superfamily